VLVYLDSSAIVKLAVREPETRALLAFLRAWPDRVTSVISTVEAPRAVRKSSATSRPEHRVRRVLRDIGLVPVHVSIRNRAAALEPIELRSLDAIHIATALDLADDVSAFVTYDSRQDAAARRAGLEVLAPGLGETPAG
jgi:hypothetical protein